MGKRGAPVKSGMRMAGMSNGAVTFTCWRAMPPGCKTEQPASRGAAKPANITLRRPRSMGDMPMTGVPVNILLVDGTMRFSLAADDAWYVAQAPRGSGAGESIRMLT
ncbi:hypothetical protein GCM10007386_08410 [Pseudoduganella dura]|nr:hypothetical protein GCM10007386_08410 [Pseudoduganella dura]